MRVVHVNEGPFVFCPRCAAAGGSWRDQHEFRCPSCGFRYFQSVAAACGVLIEREGRFLFLERAKEPSLGFWGLPGGFVDPGESAETALAREVQEEIGGLLGPVSFLASFPNRYVFEGVEYHTCDLYFQAPLTTAPEALRIDPAEVTKLHWVQQDEVTPERLAFPSLRALWLSLRTAANSR